ncbi:MAG: CCA tRNA nucleotidyltransferase [Pseudomonadota bacterium]
MGGRSSQPVTVKGDWLTSTATQAVFDAYSAAGHSVFVVGGCVRNALLGEPVSDIDMSSAVPPQTARAFLEDAGFRVVPTGIDHGTITVLSKGIPHEITTFRKDIETDGRHAVVVFSDSMEDDAARRDFTINALYADRNGQVLDPMGGLPDIQARRVQFIGSAKDRIQEDYLRSLRFFRFHARYGDAAQGFDADALAAIAANLDGLSQLSRERVGVELIKLLGVDDPAAAIMSMQQIGMLAQLMPGADAKALGPLIHIESLQGIQADAITRLASFADENQAATLRISRAQAKELKALRDAATGVMSPAEMGYRMGYDMAMRAYTLRCAFLETPPDAGTSAQVENAACAKFPISARDLSNSLSGKALGDALRHKEAEWIASGFSMTRAQLLG